MKTVRRPKLIILSLFFSFILLSLIQCENSSEETSQEDIGNGELYFRHECSACHYITTVGSLNAPSLAMLSDYDSLKLVAKLKKIGNDKIHKNRFEHYTDKEIRTLASFIKDFSKPHY